MLLDNFYQSTQGVYMNGDTANPRGPSPMLLSLKPELDAISEYLVKLHYSMTQMCVQLMQ